MSGFVGTKCLLLVSNFFLVFELMLDRWSGRQL